MTGKGFSVWFNNEYIPNNPDKAWIKEAYSKAVKRSIEDGCTAFTRFFKHQSDFPKFKKKGKSDVKMYFVRNNPKDCVCERHRLKIPTLGWVRIKEKGYIPTTKDGYVIKSGTVSIKADRYYVSVLVELPDNKTADNSNEGIGIDLGLKDFATVSNGKTYKNINKSAKLKNEAHGCVITQTVTCLQDTSVTTRTVTDLLRYFLEQFCYSIFVLQIAEYHTS